MIAAARILRLNVEPAIRIVDGCVSISGTTHSVPITLTHSSKLTGTLGAPVSHFESPAPPTGILGRYSPRVCTQANSRKPHFWPLLARVLNFLTGRCFRN